MGHLGIALQDYRWRFQLIGPKLEEIRIEEGVDISNRSRKNISVEFDIRKFEEMEEIPRALMLLKNPGLWVSELYSWEPCLHRIANLPEPNPT